jgi:hypothetical protein
MIYGDPKDPKGKSGRSKLYDDTTARSGKYMGSVLQRDFSRDPIDPYGYGFDTEIIEDGDKVMLAGDPKKGRGTVVLDRNDFKAWDLELPNQIRNKLSDASTRAQAIDWMKERNIIAGNTEGMTDQNLEDVLIRFEDSLRDLNEIKLYDYLQSHYAPEKRSAIAEDFLKKKKKPD